MKILAKLLIGLLAVGILGLVGVILFAPGIHISSLSMILNVATGSGTKTSSDALLERLRVADGFSVSVYARGLENPRAMAMSESGQLLITSPRSGSILRLEDTNDDLAADNSSVLIDGLTRPYGIALHNGYLYIGESNQIGRISFDSETTTVSGDYEVIIPDLGDSGNHWTKTIRFGPEGNLYVAMGSTCNVCVEADQRRATIMRFDADGGQGEIFASGLRNSVGMDFAPWDGALYATDNGRDMLGDDYPPCELNLVKDGGFYGWPYLNGDNDPDPDFGHERLDLQARAIPPVLHFPAHNAPLGIHFVNSDSAGWERSALVALHGSWNRSEPDGYKVVALKWDAAGTVSSEDFLWGFEEDGDIIGRPVEIVADGRGGFFISDDYSGSVYRVSQGSQAVAAALTVAPTHAQTKVVTDPQLAAAGAALYAALPCASCHSDSVATPVSLDQVPQRYNLTTLADYFLAPTPPMPRYELTTEQRTQLAHYLFSQAQLPAEK
ncbi:oxidoreductase [Halieaceae bacterium IMCC14734]|uniref:Oxidoreductase n=1 Tax=Candidatus Litorirhabdus singularis TaxID=2518993 RepID=A0ABT3TC13_9GAMM|nr:PQQ-dependent sugar dehydrogenase [Candidatus Litorirhabdus singularis]MCX2979824.1 oxidoreductase [Candidatus Litorirhabdus singularis]